MAVVQPTRNAYGTRHRRALVPRLGLTGASVGLALARSPAAVAASGLAALVVSPLPVLWRSRNNLRRRLRTVEEECEQLRRANVTLQQANAALRAAEIAQRDLLNLADEQSGGQLRALVATTGGTLARILEEELIRRPA
jgi:hypothetical protein